MVKVLQFNYIWFFFIQTNWLEDYIFFFRKWDLEGIEEEKDEQIQVQW